VTSEVLEGDKGGKGEVRTEKSSLSIWT